MTEQMFLALTLAAFGLFAVALGYVDITTANVRNQNRR